MHVRMPVTSRVIFLSVLLLPLVSASAQQYANNEFTIGLRSQTWGQQYVSSTSQTAYRHYLEVPTPAFTYTRNLSATLALEGTVQPTSQFFRTNGFEAGHELLALGGVKAGWRGRRWGFYGKTLAGIESWSCGLWYYDPHPYSNCSRITNFALEYGGVAQFQLSRHYSLRFDAAHLLSTEFDHVMARWPNQVQLRSGSTLQHLDMSIGLTRSFGSIHQASAEHIPHRAQWDIGTSFLLQPKTKPSLGVLWVYPGLGLWASWNFSRHISWDSAIFHSGPARNEGFAYSGSQSGGRSLEALTGLKIGIRRDHMGYFGKIRGGTITFGETERRLGVLPNHEAYIVRGMFTSPAIDVGGVWEVYPSRHTILRIDAGSATIYYQPKAIWASDRVGTFAGGQKIQVPGQTQTGLLLSFGAGVRF